MTIQEMIKKYRISLHSNDMLRAYGVNTEQEQKMLKDSKLEIIEYLRSEASKKAQKASEIIEKARRGEDNLFLIVCHDLSYDPHIGAARRFTDDEKKNYSEWYAKSGFVSVGDHTYLPTLKFKDMPKRETDGTFLGGSDRVWIISPEEYDKYIQMDSERALVLAQHEADEKAEEAVKIQKENEEKEALISKVDEWTIKEETIFDEGGKTKVYKHHFVIGGEGFDYTERSMFDFGIIINPDYTVTEDASRGGIALMKNGELQWHHFNSSEGWLPVRPLTENEKICYTIVAKYGKFAKSMVRM